MIAASSICRIRLSCSTTGPTSNWKALAVIAEPAPEEEDKKENNQDQVHSFLRCGFPEPFWRGSPSSTAELADQLRPAVQQRQDLLCLGRRQADVHSGDAPCGMPAAAKT